LRYYDPRVWHRLMAISTGEQRRRFFCDGDIRYVCEKNRGERAVEYWHERSEGFLPLLDESTGVQWREHALGPLHASSTN
jgi:hypothetical protein